MATAAVKENALLEPAPLRAGLQAAIARTVALKRDIAAAEEAVAACADAICEARDKAEKAQLAASEAPEKWARFEVEKRTGGAGKPPLGISAAHDAEARAAEELTALESRREHLEAQAAKAKQSLSFAQMHLNSEIASFIAGHPGTLALLASYREAREKVRSLHATLAFLRSRRCLPEGAKAFDADPVCILRTDPDPAWRNWLDRLTVDADATKVA